MTLILDIVATCSNELGSKPKKVQFKTQRGSLITIRQAPLNLRFDRLRELLIKSKSE